jgi:sigma-E factor negative regulatory protein RseC
VSLYKLSIIHALIIQSVKVLNLILICSKQKNSPLHPPIIPNYIHLCPSIEKTMDDKRHIEHEGIVEQADRNHVKVRILNQSACAACHAKGVCSAADMQEKLIDASCDREYAPGDRVFLTGESKLGLRAAWWAYILPLILMVITLFITHTLTNSENLAGLLSLAVLVPYYFIIKLFHSQFLKTFSFSIKPSTK